MRGNGEATAKDRPRAGPLLLLNRPDPNAPLAMGRTLHQAAVLRLVLVFLIATVPVVFLAAVEHEAQDFGFGVT